MKKRCVLGALAVLTLAAPVYGQKVGLSEAPAGASKDPGTTFTWELEFAPAIGDNPDENGFKSLEDNALSGSLGVEHSLPTLTYLAGSLSAEVNPKLFAPQVEGAEFGGELKLGQKILLGGGGDLTKNRDVLDLHVLGQVSHGTEVDDNVRRSYTDRKVGVEAEFTNILWLYRDLGDDERDRSKFRPGPNFAVTAGWSKIDSNRDDRDNAAITAEGLLKYVTRGGIGWSVSAGYEKSRYSNVDTTGFRRKDKAISAYAGLDFSEVLGRRWKILDRAEIGAEVTNTDSNDNENDDTSVYLRLKIAIGG